MLQYLLSGQYAYPVRIVCFNASEGWSRDATSNVPDALVSPALQDFIAANGTRRLGVQLMGWMAP